MERWEIIERWVLVAVGIALIAFCAWALVYAQRGIIVLLLLPPVIFWVFWQAFYEDNQGTSEPVSGAERAMYDTYLWARRLVLGGIALALGAAAFGMALAGMDLTAILLVGGLALFTGWVALFGAGRSKSMSDDLQTHRERRKRYR